MGVDPTSWVASSLIPWRGPAFTRTASTGVTATASIRQQDCFLLPQDGLASNCTLRLANT